jgi:polygalacturonase
VDGVDGFTLFGEGTIDGNGMRAWKAFWHRRKWNPNCTNKDEQRPRLVFISNSKNVTVAGLRMQNSPFWTNHIYKCSRVKYLGCDIFSPHAPVIAPSTDGLDIDVCQDVLVKNCRFEVSDDGIALKGGKGPWADTLPENGANERVLIEDCFFGPCCAVLTCGSESIRNKNILARRVEVDGPGFVLWLKMRPDTPQKYEYVTFEEINGFVGSFLFVKPWTQFFDLKDRKDIPMSYAENITMKNSKVKCHCFFNVELDKSQYRFSDILLENITALAKEEGFNQENQEGVTLKNIQITKCD